MKKFLLSLSLFSSFVFFSSTAISQGTNACDVKISNVQISITKDPEVINASQCRITFNISFNIANNAGNKYIYLHSFLANEYGAGSLPCPKNGTEAAPNASRLGTTIGQPSTSFFDIGINNNVTALGIGQPVDLPILTSYTPDATVALTTPANSAGIKVTRTAQSTTVNKIDITDVTVIINQSCADELIVKTDVWASQQSDAKQAQCWTCPGEVTSTFNNPTISGRINCANPRTYNLNITTTSASDQKILYKVYVDVNENNTVETIGEDRDSLVFVSDSIVINKLTPHGVSGVNYLPVSGQPEYGDKNLLVELTSSSFVNSRLQVLKIDPNIPCSPLEVLPVTYAAFTATRSSNSQVVLEWETAMEENNKGFHVQRNVNGEWKNIGFVFTQANNGNSSSNLKYTFKDANSSKGISQYRILQVDMDGKGKYSEVRSIRGEEMAARLTVFPNPSNTGSFSILFEDGSSVRDVVVSDVSGRAVKQYKGVSNSSLTIENLGAGFYTVQVLNRTTGALATEKVIIKKR